MGTGVLTARPGVKPVADTVLKATVRFWFVVAVIGQLVFVFSVASFYGRSAARGDWDAWNRSMTHGYIPGHAMGNFTVAMHLFSAVAVLASGVLQLIPQIQRGAPSFHRWNGRLYILFAFTVSIAGLDMIWVRGSIGDLPQHLASTLNAVLIMLCAVMAWRYAVARDFRKHRRWALRLFLVVAGVWFFRIGMYLSFAVFKGPIGFDTKTFTGPFLTFLGFAAYLLPLAVLELYLRTQDRPGAPRRIAMATGLFVLTLVMGVGIVANIMAVWLPRIKASYDSRRSIAETLSATIASGGIDRAAGQYHELKAAEPTTYNFDEGELNALGYKLLQANQGKEAIRILQLNVEAYPQSSNAYDSLAEAYMDDGNKPQAIANYRRSLELDPNNRNAVQTLQKLSAP